MEPKEKATELMNKFFNYCSYEWYEGEEGHKENMKQCALIAVNEMIKELQECFIYCMYWHKVKQEIEKL